MELLVLCMLLRNQQYGIKVQKVKIKVSAEFHSQRFYSATGSATAVRALLDRR